MIDREQRAALAQLWAFRCQSEHEARARFAGLASALAEQQAPKTVIALAERAVGDEGRHRDACAALARRFGHTGPTHRAVGLPRLGPAELSSRRRTIYTAVAIGCVVESLNVALLGETLRVAEDRQTREVTREILRDEVCHAKAGWAHLAAVQDDTAFLAPLLPRMLASAAGEALLAEAREDVVAPTHGLLSRRRLRELFFETLEHVVVAGLAARGLDVSAAERWRRSA